MKREPTEFQVAEVANPARYDIATRIWICMGCCQQSEFKTGILHLSFCYYGQFLDLGRRING